MATIEHSNSSASRGVGVIMGDKRLKAIAVRGTKDINVAQPAELFARCAAQYTEIYDNPNCGCVFRHEDDESWHVNNFAWGNARERVRGIWTEEREKAWESTTRNYEVRWTGCYNCPKDCHIAIRYPGRQIFQLKCYSKLTYAMAAYEELDFNYKILSFTQEYGLDGFTTPAGARLRGRALRGRHPDRRGRARTSRPTRRGGSSTWSRRSCAAKASATSSPTACTGRPARSARAPKPSTTTP